jgi:hypothetical protein
VWDPFHHYPGTRCAPDGGYLPPALPISRFVLIRASIRAVTWLVTVKAQVHLRRLRSFTHAHRPQLHGAGPPRLNPPWTLPMGCRDCQTVGRDATGLFISALCLFVLTFRDMRSPFCCTSRSNSRRRSLPRIKLTKCFRRLPSEVFEPSDILIQSIWFSHIRNR